MKSTFLMILVFIVSQSFGQKFKSMSIGFSASTEVNYRQLSSPDVFNQQIISIRNATETPKISNSVSVAFRGELSDKWMMEIGIQYANLGFQQDLGSMRFEDQIDSNGTFGSPALNLKVKSNYHYAEVPIRMLYHQNTNPVQFVAGCGLIPGYLMLANFKAISTDAMTSKKTREVNKDKENYNKFSLSPTISAGISYQISENLHFGMETTLRYGILSITEKPISGNLYNGGLRFTSFWML